MASYRKEVLINIGKYENVRIGVEEDYAMGGTEDHSLGYDAIRLSVDTKVAAEVLKLHDMSDADFMDTMMSRREARAKQREVLSRYGLAHVVVGD